MIRIYNTKNRTVEDFKPQTPGKVGMYICGPTVYDRAHLGNARPYVLFGAFIKMLRLFYDVKYVRNITDIDDKIITASQKTGKTIKEITEETTRHFHQDMAAVGALAPDEEPKATEFVTEMIEMTEQLIEKGHAYAADGHVLFDVSSKTDYGCLSKSNQEEILAGARVEVAPYKRNASDFVLWKPSSDDVPGWDSPWGRGRPGWHIECSAMSFKHLGKTFDIHAGGRDLIFPHHENEIAQSTSVHGCDTFAQYWMHNGILTVNGEKMSKSLGNFITVQDLLSQAHGETIHYALLSTHYRQPLDWTDESLTQAKASLDRLYTALKGVKIDHTKTLDLEEIDQAFLSMLKEDFNTAGALARLHELATIVNKTSESDRENAQKSLLSCGLLLGLFTEQVEDWFKVSIGDDDSLESQEIESWIQKRLEARGKKDFAEADRIRDWLKEQGIILEDSASGTEWRRL